MGFARKSRRDRAPSPLLVALLLSVLLHQVAITMIAALVSAEEPEPPERMEVTLLEEPPPPEPPRPPQPPEPEPDLREPREPTRRPRPAPAAPAPEPAEPEPAGIAQAPPSPEPMPEAPEPEPVDPSRVQVKLDWAAFDRTFGDTAAEEREEHHRRSMERRRGTMRLGSFSARVRKALATNRSWVSAGEQEALGKRQRTFRNYIEAIHDRIHPIFADSFLASLSIMDASDPLNDFSLMAKLEFEILESGHLNELRVIRTSGNTVFDAAAVDSIYRSAPYPPPPKRILSWNDRVYLRWGFYRNRRKCGVFNVEPYILTAPGAGEREIPPADFVSEDG